LCAASMAVVGVSAHGGGVAHQKPLQVDSDADWATRHMAGRFISTQTSSDQIHALIMRGRGAPHWQF